MGKKRKNGAPVLGSKRKKLSEAPAGSDFIRRRGVVFVRVNWEDKTAGESHYSPVTALKCDDKNIVAGSRVRMKHGGREWFGIVAQSSKFRQPLVEGKPYEKANDWSWKLSPMLDFRCM